MEDSNSDAHIAEKSKRRRRSRVWLASGIFAIVLLIVLIVILVFTVFKPKKPITTIDSIALKDLDFDLNVMRLSVNLNLTLLVDASVTNPNNARFKYRNFNTNLNYRDRLIGIVPVPAGDISADETVGLNLTLTVLADRLLTNSQIYSDALAGSVPMNTYLKMSGMVTFLGFVKFHLVTSSSCDFIVDLGNRNVTDQQCTYKNKF